MKTEKREQGTYNRYSVAFKMRVVEEVENGMISVEGARKLYSIPGKGTIYEWVQQYGINKRINKAVYIMTNDEQRELIRLRKENARLLQALDDSHIKNLALETLIEVADETYGTDLKKNFGSQLQQELKKKLKTSNLDVGSE